ncbi:MAG: hypothetical protein QNJ01_16940 [Desulfobacterales bacterium]|nr:hypothetical protein [Desulfobacterales bacterium]
MEFYYSGIGDDEPERSLAGEDLSKSLARRELVNLIRYYLAQELPSGLRPRVNFFGTDIINLEDSSGFFQPRFVWDMADAWCLTVGGINYYSGDGSEYGSFRISNAPFRFQLADAVFALLASFYNW